MKEHINIKGSKESTQEVSNNVRSKNIVRSRIPIRIPPLKDKFSVTNTLPKPKTSCLAPIKSMAFQPEVRYGKDRTRLVSNCGKRFGKSALESQISLKYRKYNWEKSKLIKQQLNYEKECDEMKELMGKVKTVGESEFRFNEFDLCNDTKASGDSVNNELSLDPQDCDRQRQEMSSVHHKLMTSNTEIFTLLKGLGEKATQLYYHQTMKSLNRKPNDNFFANILKLKTKFLEATKEGNYKFLEYENEINQLKTTNEDLTEELKLAKQQLVSQATENKSIQDNREESFMKIEEKLRDIIDKLQCQFRAQKLLQAKTERELAVLRSNYFSLERENNKLTNCSNELKDCQMINGKLKEQADFHCKEKEEMVKKYEKQFVGLHSTIDRMESELMEARSKNNEFSAANTKG